MAVNSFSCFRSSTTPILSSLPFRLRDTLSRRFFCPPPPLLPLRPKVPQLHRVLVIRSLDTTKLFDSEAQISNKFQKSNKLKIALVGFGILGQFLAKTLIRQGHIVSAYSQSDHTDAARKLGVTFFSKAENLFEEDPEVIVIYTSIISAEEVLRSLPLNKLKHDALFVDVLYAKELLKNLFLQILPQRFDILCTHPLLDLHRGNDALAGIAFFYEKVRIGSCESRVSRCGKFLDVFAKEGCLMTEMSCEEHDITAVGYQFVAYTLWRLVQKLGLNAIPRDSKESAVLKEVVESTGRGCFALYKGLFMSNKNATEQLKQLDFALAVLREDEFSDSTLDSEWGSTLLFEEE